MKTYKIFNIHSGLFLGEYSGQNERIALDAMAKDAGFFDYVDLLDQIPGAKITDLEIYEMDCVNNGKAN